MPQPPSRAPGERKGINMRLPTILVSFESADTAFVELREREMQLKSQGACAAGAGGLSPSYAAQEPDHLQVR